MRRLLMSLLLMMNAVLTMPQTNCSEMFISEYVEAIFNNKALEIYNPTSSAIMLDDSYRLIRWSNGSETSDQDTRYILPLAGTVEAYHVMVIIQDTLFPGQDTMLAPGLKAHADFLAPADYDSGDGGCRVVFWDGDDAISLQKKMDGSWVDVDIFGEIGVRPLNWQGGTDPVGAWDDTPPYWDGQGTYLTKAKTMVRKSSVKTGIFRDEMDQYGTDSFNALTEYDSLPAQTYDNLGIHVCDCGTADIVDLGQLRAIRIFPNPVPHGNFQVLAREEIRQIELFNLAGNRILLLGASGKRVQVTLPEGTATGIYLVRTTDANGMTGQGKLVVW